MLGTDNTTLIYNEINVVLSVHFKIQLTGF